MSISNTFTIDVDFKKKRFLNEPVVTSNDDITFIISVFNDGKEYDLSNVTTFILASLRPDKQSVMTLGTKTDTNQVTFNLGTTELQVTGRVEAQVQLYDADGRVSTLYFTYQVIRDLVGNYIPSRDEQTLIEKVLGEGPVIIDEAKQVATELNNLNVTISNNEAIRQSNEETRIANENNRISAETTRENNEQSRIDAENTRNSNEATRESNETTRQENEANRQTQFNDKINEINTLLPNVQNLENAESWNNSIQYHKNNIVEFNGSSFMALQDSLGQQPPTLPTKQNEYWSLLAQRGVDGTGAVSTVNGISPDVNGNVPLTASDVGAYVKPTNGIPSTDLDSSVQSSLEKANTALQNVPDASTTAKGVVQLNDTLTSTSATEALTANQGKVLDDKINVLSQDVGDKTTLNTTDKSNVVGAINEVDNNVTTLNTTFTGRLADIDKKIIGIVDAREYGAIGDGIADDSDAIQEMLNSPYKNVVLRNGVFRITKGLTSNLEGRTIKTEGATILADTQDIIVLTVTGSNNKISININGNNKAAVGALIQSGGCEVSNSRIENLYGTSIGSCGIRAETSNGIVIINNVIKNINAVSNSTIGDNIGSARAVLLTSMTQATDLSIIKNNVIDNILGEEGDAIQILFYDNANNSKFLKALAIVENNTIKNCNRRAIKIQGTDVDVLSNTHINTLIASQLNGAFLIDIINSDNVRIIGNKLDARLFKAMQLTGNANDIAKNLIVKNNILNCDDAFVQNGIYINIISNSEISNNTIINGSPSISIGGSKNLIIESNKFFGDNVEKIAINIISSNDNICCYSNVSYGSRLYLVQNAAPNCIIEDNHNRSNSGGCIRTFATSIGSVYRNNTNNSSTTTVIGDLLDQYHSGARNTGNYISGIPDIIFTADIPSTIMPNRYFSKGTISFNTNVVANGKVGWVCTTNGLGATSTWKPFGVVDA